MKLEEKLANSISVNEAKYPCTFGRKFQIKTIRNCAGTLGPLLLRHNFLTVEWSSLQIAKRIALLIHPSRGHQVGSSWLALFSPAGKR